MASGFRGLLELLGLWPSAPPVPDQPGCAESQVLPVGAAEPTCLLVARADAYALPAGAVTISVERC